MKIPNNGSVIIYYANRICCGNLWSSENSKSTEWPTTMLFWNQMTWKTINFTSLKLIDWIKFKILNLVQKLFLVNLLKCVCVTYNHFGYISVLTALLAMCDSCSPDQTRSQFMTLNPLQNAATKCWPLLLGEREASRGQTRDGVGPGLVAKIIAHFKVARKLILHLIAHKTRTW